MISWLLGMIEPHLITNIRCFFTAQAIWAYLHRIYHQDNSARMAPDEGGLGSLDSGLELEQDLYSGRAWTLFLLSWF